MAFTTAVFDLDGTLIDSAGIAAQIFNSMLRKRGYAHRVDARAIQPTLSVGGEAMVRAVLGKVSIAPAAELREFRLLYSSMPTPVDSLYSGVRGVLAGLQQLGVRIGLCTKKPEALVDKILADLGLRDRFDVVSCGDTTAHPKPDRRHLLGVLERLGAHRSESILIGDSVVDFNLAHNADVAFAFASYGYDDGDVPIDECHSNLACIADVMALRWQRVEVSAADRGTPAAAPMVANACVAGVGARSV